MGNKGTGPSSPHGRRLAAEKAARSGEHGPILSAEPAVLSETPTDTITHTLTPEVDGNQAAIPPAEPLQGGDVGNVREVPLSAVKVSLWLPVELGGGDVAILCKLTEAQINLLQVRAEERSCSVGEILEEFFARGFDNAWVY